MSNIRMSQEELRFISILEGLTGALAIDCIWDKSETRVIFVLRRNDTGKVIGRGGTTIRRLREHFHKQIDIVEYSENLEIFAANTLAPAKTKNVEIHEKLGKKTVVVTVIPKERGKAIGKNGRNIQRSRLLMKRHFGVKNVIIQSPP
ncbi:MAG: NusA-like transcription termination signal-binding factor [Candidatus Heimdallarchaeota archaeon]|nr:MAG: NusA-like transcription termination signal-binding factor [Candidatus Heimdallarchaeota archaeon]